VTYARIISFGGENMESIRRTKKRLASKLMQLKCLIEVHKRNVLRHKEHKEKTLVLLKAQKIVQDIACTIQQEIHSKIAQVVSKCLSAVFHSPYEFRIEFEQKRGKTSARMVFCRDGLILSPLKSTSGGMIEIASMALRIACIAISKPKKRGILILDEPFRCIYPETHKRIPMMLESLHKELGIQFIMITNIQALECGTIFNTGVFHE
jgi:ABC-type glutathione transport system ATPase component